MHTVYVYDSYYLIDNVHTVPKQIEYDLAKWNPAYFRKDPIGYYYDKDNAELRIPRGYHVEAINAIFSDIRFEYCENNNKYESSNIGLLNFPRDYMQENVLAFMTAHYPFDKLATASQLYVDLTTGYGKTYLMVATACYYKAKCLVLIPAISKIGNQWMDTLSNFTTLNSDEYLYVHGSEMCKDIIKGKYEKVKFFIMPRSTVLAFVRTFGNDWSMFTKLVDAMGVSIKAIDEAHMDFNTIVNIDCFTNVPKTYYMSSSPSRSDAAEKNIYARIFKGVPRFGKKLITMEQNHIIPVIIEFKSAPSFEWQKKIRTRYGTSLTAYGDYLLAEDGARTEFLNAYLFTLYWALRFRRDNGKILVICATIDFAKEIREITSKFFPYLSSGLFVGSGKDKNKELNNDIVFSTTKSMGTGSEIKNHQITINTMTYSSDVMADQITGRLRKQPSERKALYCEILNVNHPIAMKHYEARKPYLAKKAKNGQILQYSVSEKDINEVANFIKSGCHYNKDGMVITKDNSIKISKRKQPNQKSN